MTEDVTPASAVAPSPYGAEDAVNPYFRDITPEAERTALRAVDRIVAEKMNRMIPSALATPSGVPGYVAVQADVLAILIHDLQELNDRYEMLHFLPVINQKLARLLGRG